MQVTKRNYLREYAIILGLTLLAYAIRTTSGQFPSSFNFILFVLSLLFISFGWEVLYRINEWLNRVLPFDKNMPLRISVQLVIGILLGLAVRFLVFLFGEPQLTLKLDNLFLVATWVLYVLGTTIMNGIFITQNFIYRWKDSIEETARLEKEKALVQFDNLKNQINPHFLFNALSALDSLISENPRLASQFLQHLSRVYRYVLQNKDRTTVALDVELDFIQNYIFLVETRFQKSLHIRVDIPAAYCDKLIVPVTLQILIENAIKHNVASEGNPLTIEIAIWEDCLVVHNNFQPRKNVETSNGQGLQNLKSLYRFLTTKPIAIHQDGNFEVRIPLLESNQPIAFE